MDVRPYEIRVPDDQLTDLRQRLGRIRWPHALDDDIWEDGSSLARADLN